MKRAVLFSTPPVPIFGHSGRVAASSFTITGGDPANSPINSIDYYESVRSFPGKYPDARSDASKPVDDFYRLFMVPGMGHCGGGIGPNTFANGGDPEHDILSALENWVEKGVAPGHLIGRGTVGVIPPRR